jgi:hypothetical protein
MWMDPGEELGSGPRVRDVLGDHRFFTQLRALPRPIQAWARWGIWRRSHVKDFPGCLGRFASTLKCVLPTSAAEATWAAVLPFPLSIVVHAMASSREELRARTWLLCWATSALYCEASSPSPVCLEVLTELSSVQ